MKWIVIVILLVLIGSNVWLLNRTNQLESKIMSVETKESLSTESKEEDGYVELSLYMRRLQYYTDKLYYAGQAKNKELSVFYLEEMEQVMIEIAKLNLLEEGKNVSQLMVANGMNAHEVVEKDFRQNGFANFDSTFTSLIGTCNSCHKQCDHGFIEVTVPKGEPRFNQNFAPQKQ
jgi:hypothetical protein